MTDIHGKGPPRNYASTMEKVSALGPVSRIVVSILVGSFLGTIVGLVTGWVWFSAFLIGFLCASVFLAFAVWFPAESTRDDDQEGQ